MTAHFLCATTFSMINLPMPSPAVMSTLPPMAAAAAASETSPPRVRELGVRPPPDLMAMLPPIIAEEDMSGDVLSVGV